MAIAIEQSAYGTSTSVGHTTTSATFPSSVPSGRTLVAIVSIDGADAITGHGAISTPSGWTRLDTALESLAAFGRVAGAGESTTVTVTHNATDDSTMQVHQMPAGVVFDAIAEDATPPGTPTVSIPSVSPTSGRDALLLAAMQIQAPWNLNASPSGYSLVTNQGTFVIRQCAWSKAVDPTSGAYSSSGPTYANTPTSAPRVHIAFVAELVPFTADFGVDQLSGDAPLTVAFTDESFGGTGTPDTWLWDFGDGSSSSLQDPTHVYTIAGTYTVTLTVETDDAETDSETKTAFITVGDVYVAPPASNAVVEIRAAAPGSSRWGSAKWGTGSPTSGRWSPAGWQDVTPQSVDAYVRWGSHSPERGILTETEAATWIVNTYDPERLLDPGNTDSPYATDLRAGLPIRIRHRGTIVRQGVAESIAFYHRDTVGGIRVTDLISLMSRTPVPEDSVLADTLRARARDAIAAAGLRVTVEGDPPGGDPALAPRLEGDRSVWRHIADAAEQVLHIAYVDRIGTLKFRAWSAPYDRGRGVDETQLVDLGAVVETRGLYSVVSARELAGEGGDLIERRLTPTPRYGSVAYVRDDATPDAGAWADAVLADRSLQTVTWIPGMIYPLDADAVEYFATMEAIERFQVVHSGASPLVGITGIVVGGSFRVTAQRDAEAFWTFDFDLAQTATSPLYSDTDPPEFLLSSAGDEFLYPSGG